MIRLLGHAILSVIQLAVVVTAFWGLSLLLLYYAGPLVPGYTAYTALGHALFVFVIVLVWDRFFGPYSFLLRRTAKILHQAQQQREEN
jgi:hypothetical protein